MRSRATCDRFGRVFYPSSAVKRVLERLLLAEYTETGGKNGDEVVRGGKKAYGRKSHGEVSGSESDSTIFDRLYE